MEHMEIRVAFTVSQLIKNRLIRYNERISIDACEDDERGRSAMFGEVDATVEHTRLTDTRTSGTTMSVSGQYGC